MKYLFFWDFIENPYVAVALEDGKMVDYLFTNTIDKAREMAVTFKERYPKSLVYILGVIE
jgi:hypothetical protein